MKNLDIEKLERKNIYKAPEDFFAKVQQNVLQEVQEETQSIPVGRNKNYQWWYAAAAAIALIFGGTFLLNSGGDNTSPNLNQNSVAVVDKSDKQTKVSSVPENPATENYQSLVADLTIVENTNQKSTKVSPEKTPEVKNTKSFASNSAPKLEEQVELMLQEFSAEDIAILTQNTEQDVYLDLYY